MDRREQVLTAARKVFARDGFNGATMESIATEAGLKTPSHLYWYFKNKKELLQAVTESLSPVLQSLSEFYERIDDPPDKLFDLLSARMLSTFDNPEARQLIRILISEAPRIPDTATAFSEKMVLALNFVVAYIEHQIEKGTIRPHNAQSSARAFIGAMLVYMLGSELFLPMRAGLPSKDVFRQELVDIFMRGIKTAE